MYLTVVDLRGWPEKEFFAQDDFKMMYIPDGDSPPADYLPLPEGAINVCFMRECFIINQSEEWVVIPVNYPIK